MDKIKRLALILLISAPVFARAAEGSLDGALWYFESMNRGNYPHLETNNQYKKNQLLSFLIVRKDDPRVLALLEKAMRPVVLNTVCGGCFLPFVGFFFKSVQPQSLQLSSDIFNGRNKAQNDYIKNQGAGSATLASYRYLLNQYIEILNFSWSANQHSPQYAEFLASMASKFLVQLNVDQGLLENTILDNFHPDAFNIRNFVIKKYFTSKYAEFAEKKIDEIMAIKIKNYWLDKLLDKNSNESFFYSKNLIQFARNPKIQVFLKQNWQRMFKSDISKIPILIWIGFHSRDAQLRKIAIRLLNMLLKGDDKSFERFFGRPAFLMFRDMISYGSHLNRSLYDRDHDLAVNTKSQMKRLNELRNHLRSAGQKSSSSFEYRSVVILNWMLEAPEMIDKMAQNPDYFQTFNEMLPEFHLDYTAIKPLVEFYAVSRSDNYRKFGVEVILKMKGKKYLETVLRRYENQEFAELIEQLNDKEHILNQFYETSRGSYLLQLFLNKRPELNVKLKNILSLDSKWLHTLPTGFFLSLCDSDDQEIKEMAVRALKRSIFYDVENKRRSDLEAFESYLGSWNRLVRMKFGYNGRTSDAKREFFKRSQELFLKLGFSQAKIELLSAQLAEVGWLDQNIQDFMRWQYEKSFGQEAARIKLENMNRRAHDSSTVGGHLRSLVKALEKGELDLNESIRFRNNMLLNTAEMDFYIDTSFLAKHFDRLSTLPVPILCWVYVVAFGTMNGELQRAALHDLQKKIAGEDADFNRTYGKNLKSISERYKYFVFYFSQLAHLKGVGILTQELLLKLNLPLNDIARALHEMTGESSALIEVKFARELLSSYQKKHVQYDFSGRTFSHTQSPFKNYAFINGGYSEYTNYDLNELDLLTYHYGLFHGKARLINANGPKSKVTSAAFEGRISLKENGDIDINSREGMDLPAAKATNENLEKLIKEMASENPDATTIVYGGHGSRVGLAFWNSEYVSAKNIRRFYKNFSAHTQVRSLYLQCYAGAALVGIYRMIPERLDRAKNFLETYYPENKCGLAMSMHDEIGQFYNLNSNIKDWTQSKWMKLFKWHYNPSLRDFRDYLWNDNQVKPTPILTTDYFISDFRGTLCRERAGLLSRSASATISQMARAAIEMRESHLIELCEGEAETRYKQATEEYVKLQNLENSLAIMDIIWTRELIQVEFPDVAKSFDEKSEDIQKVLDQYGLDSLGGEMSLEDLAKVQSVIFAPGSADYERLLAALPLVVKYKPFYDRKMLAYMKENEEQYKSYMTLYKDGSETKDRILGAVYRAINAAAEVRLSEKRALGMKLFKRRKELVEKLFELPEFMDLNKRYMNLNQCEATAIN